MSYTLVSFHAHPDDEALLTGGTLARAAAEGHRVILVVATDGAAGLTSRAVLASGDTLAAMRRQELDTAARALGVDAVFDLGYGDSGDDDSGDRSHRAGPRETFARADVEAAAAELAAILRAERADVLTIYDRAGGYGHPDHVRIHAVGTRAAALAGTPVLLEATVDRARLQRGLRLIGWLPGLPAGFRAGAFADRYCAPRELTHRIDVREYLAAKRAAMTAHASQSGADDGARTLAFCLRLPHWLYARVFGYEWFREPDRAPGGPLLDDIFATLRAR